MNAFYCISEENGTAPSVRMLATGAAVFLLSTFALAGAPEPIQGSFAVQQDVVPHEVRAGKDSYDQKARRIIPSPALFANAQLQGASLSTDGSGVGGAVPEALFMSAQETALIGYQEPPQGIIPPRESTPEPQEGGIRTHVVAEGETLSIIAQKYGIDVNTILWSNDVGSADLINVGDQLVILPTSGVMHEVSDGETLSAIASRYKVEVDAITKANGISSSTIFAGQKLVIPGASPAVRPTTNRPNVAGSSKDSNARSVSGYFGRPAAGYLSQGLHPTNAVDIAGSCWSPIYAAAGGTIALAAGGGGWNGGYGNYVAIDHANGTRTLYAHLIQVNTSTGKYVNQGAVIGYMGSTGRSTGCHVHFEVRGAKNPIR